MSESQLAGNDSLIINYGGGVVIAPDWAAVASLNKKMALVMLKLTTVHKDAKHEKQGWTYASYSEVAEAVRQAMAAANLGLFIHVVNIGQHDAGSGVRSEVELEFTFADGDSGAMRICRWVGEAVDFGTADKGLNKAYTASEKYFLMRTFLVSTSDDVDPDSEGESAKRSTPAQTRQAPPPNAPIAPVQPVQPTNGTAKAPPARPADPETVRGWLQKRANAIPEEPPVGNELGAMIGALNRLWLADSAEIQTFKRHALLHYVFGVTSSTLVNRGQCEALRNWASTFEDGEYRANPHAMQEAAKIIEADEASQGQQPLDMGQARRDEGKPADTHTAEIL